MALDSPSQGIQNRDASHLAPPWERITELMVGLTVVSVYHGYECCRSPIRTFAYYFNPKHSAGDMHLLESVIHKMYRTFIVNLQLG